MSRDGINVLNASFERIHGMLVAFTDACPENIWHESFGGYPVWQQAFHAFACYDFFVRGLDEAPSPLYFGDKEGDVIHFQAAPKVVSKAEMKEAAATAKSKIDAFFATFKDDAELYQKHEGLSARIGVPFTILGLMVALSTHGFYHLGSCDAALRQNGLQGIF